MCIFSRPVGHVAATRIFARSLPDGSQALAYSMNVELGEPTAMILPLPIPPGSGEDAIRFVDLSGYPTFFEDVSKAFPAPAPALGRMLAAQAAPVRTLKVHKVGSFVASFVPSLNDFSRLDECFRLPASVASKLPYEDWGFAVFQLEDKRGLLGGAKRQTIHPMAFVFPRRDPRTLFFPTKHVHDGAVHDVVANVPVGFDDPGPCLLLRHELHGQLR